MTVKRGGAMRARAAVYEASPELQSGCILFQPLVVMIIIGILAAIAIPVFLNQRAKAHDASTKAEIGRASCRVRTYYFDGQGALTHAQAGGASNPVTITDAAGNIVTSVKLSRGT